MNAGLNIGDLTFQLFAVGVPIFSVVLLFLFWRYLKKNKEQLNRIEQKLDSNKSKN